MILNVWNISHGPHIFPKRWKAEICDFLENKELQFEIERLFGTYIRNYVVGLANNEYNLQYLPTKVFLHILKYLAASDVIRLSQTSKIFFSVHKRSLINEYIKIRCCFVDL